MSGVQIHHLRPLATRLDRPWATFHSPDWSFADHLALEQDEVEAVASGQSSGSLLLSEVSPVLTQGRGSTDGDLWIDRAGFEARKIAILPVSRGGKTTYHGPGQWVLFPVSKLETLVGDTRGVRKVVCALLKIAQETADDFGLETEIREGAEAGLWTRKGKLASLGIQIDQGIVRHGLSLNVYETEKSFFGIHPCGLTEARPDYVFSGGLLGTSSDGKTSNENFMRVGERLIHHALNRFPVFAPEHALDVKDPRSYTQHFVSSHVGS